MSALEYRNHYDRCDQDSGDTLTYSIVDGNDEGVFEIDSSTGQIEIASTYDQSAGYLDYERADSLHPEDWNLTIQVTLTPANTAITITLSHSQSHTTTITTTSTTTITVTTPNANTNINSTTDTNQHRQR